jgi:heme/copper-type cytochrome/quinol oxidase subunit 1
LAFSKVYINTFLYNCFAFSFVVVLLLPVLAGGKNATSLPIYHLTAAFDYQRLNNIIGVREFDVCFEERFRGKSLILR